MSQAFYGKTVYELIEECLKRGRVDSVEFRGFISRAPICTMDRWDAVDEYGSETVLAHTRKRGHLTIWI